MLEPLEGGRHRLAHSSVTATGRARGANHVVLAFVVASVFVPGLVALPFT